MKLRVAGIEVGQETLGADGRSRGGNEEAEQEEEASR